MDVSDIKKVFVDNAVDLTKNDIWKVQQAWVIKHAALERLAAKLGIQFERPEMLQGPHLAQFDGTSYAMLVTGRRAIKGETYYEWSVGEVNASNYRTSGKQPAYPWAMVEKRAKDRVIIKLAGLHGAYSEDEADDFSNDQKKEFPKAVEEDQPAEKPVAKAARPKDTPAKPLPAVGEKTPFVYEEEDLAGLTDEQRVVCGKIIAVEEIDQLTDLMASPRVQDIINSADPKNRAFIRGFGGARLKSLGWLAAKPAPKPDAPSAA